MLSIFYYFDDGKSDIIFYYENKRDEYLSETALSILPARFKRQKQMDEGYEYVRMPGLTWYHDSIGDTVVYSYVRDLYKHIWENTKQEKGKRIYISRDSRSNAGRAVTNEKEVRKMLKGLNISSYDPIDMTVIDSIRLFKSAELVTGPHGAGLTWLTFCESNTIFCEVYKNKPLKDHFYHLAKGLGIEYWKFTNLISDSATENTDPTKVDDGNYSIDIQTYKEALEHLIQKVECKNIQKNNNII
jgi:hypothetical protein